MSRQLENGIILDNDGTMNFPESVPDVMYIPDPSENKLQRCYYIDDNRSIVETAWLNNNDNHIRIYRYMKDEPAYEELLTIIDEDEIHRRTFDYIVKNRETFEAAMLEVGRVAGEIEDLKGMSDENVLDHIMGLIYRNDQRMLFKLKRKIFQLDEVDGILIEGNHEDVRAEIRDATTIAGALGGFGKIIDAINENNSSEDRE